jgi:regulator of cell morphogenesis and NO signaling
MNVETKTIGEIALEVPKAIAVLEKWNIDYCCRGGRSVAQACEEAGVTVAALLDEIGTAGGGEAARDWSAVTLTELQRFIVDTHHVFTREMLDTVKQLSAKVATRHGEHHPEVRKVELLVGELNDDLLPHMMKEEEILFPFVAALEAGTAPASCFGTIENPIRMMMFEHEAVGELLVALRGATDNYTLPADACLSFRALYERLTDLEKDLHRHIALENSVLFPRAAQLEVEAGRGSVCAQ